MIPVMMHADEEAAMREIVGTLPDETTIVEWGAGGSTIMFADLLGPKQHLITIEHKHEWFQNVRAELAEHPNRNRVTVLMIPLSFPIEVWQFARPEEETGAGASKYICGPEFLWKDHPQWSSVGLVLVDGIARGPCLASLRTKVLPQTRIFLHDYTGREVWYDWAANLYERVGLTNMLLELRVPIA